MEQRYVGSSGLQVSSLSLGTLGWGAQTDDEEAADLLGVFLDSGGTAVDVTAGLGTGAEVLGRLLERAHDRSELVIMARAGRWGTPAAPVADLSRRGLLQALDVTLAALGTDHVDLWSAHGWSDDVPLEETLSALSYAQSTGRARYVGVSDQRGWQVARAATTCSDVVACSVSWSLVARHAEAEVVPACASLGLGVLAWGALGHGVLTGKYRTATPRDSRAARRDPDDMVPPDLGEHSRTVVEAVATAALGLSSTAATVALAWLWGRPELASAVVGPRTADQLSHLVDADALVLPDQIAAVLDEVSGWPPGSEGLAGPRA